VNPRQVWRDYPITLLVELVFLIALVVLEITR